jgi:phage terminase large subunit
MERQTHSLEYEPRAQFLPFHNREQRWAVIVAHRRAGKTVACINEAIERALELKQPDGRFAYVAPFYAQAKDVAWLYLKRYAAPVLAETPNESELRVTLLSGSSIRLYGADNADRLRGIYLDGLVGDEVADWRPGVWEEVLRPALVDRQGWAVFIGTPRGKNEFWKLWMEARKAPGEWFRLMLKASETGLILPGELAAARRSMSFEQFEQEFECSFEAAVQGAFYAEQLRRMEQDKRICRLPVDRCIEVHTGWDLGYSDSTAIWFVQCVGKERRLVDYYEASGVGFEHYAQVLRDKGYVYGRHYFPHDVSHKMIGMDRSRVETLRGLGIEPEIVPQHDVMDGINAVRRMLDQTWIDQDRCERGLEALRQYRREYDDKLKTFRPKPLHDWSSHGADALRCFAVGFEPVAEAGKSPAPYYGESAWLGA